MATLQTYSGLAPEQQTFYDRTLLDRLLPNLCYANYGQKKPIPKNDGDTISFRRFNTLAAAVTPLTEGTVPAGNTLSITAVPATVAQYGDFITTSDKLDMIGMDPVVTETSQLFGEQASNTIDQVVRDIVTAGTTIQYASTAISRITVATGMNLTSTEIKKAVRTLRRANAAPVSGGMYIGIIGPDAQYDLMLDTAWLAVSEYSAASQIFNGEIGSLYGVKFILTSNAKKFTGLGAAGIDVFGTMIIGANAYGVVDVAGSSKPQIIVKPLGSSGSADPLNQMQSIGWKAMFTAIRLQELAMVRIEHAASL
jgi:N4-gp56 family major capsid protein